MDVLHAMKDALMKYETIDALQIDDLMARTTVRPPAGWEDKSGSNSNDKSDNDAQAAKSKNDDSENAKDVEKSSAITPDTTEPSADKPAN
jgi:cell division protease FtsH